MKEKVLEVKKKGQKKVRNLFLGTFAIFVLIFFGTILSIEKGLIFKELGLMIGLAFSAGIFFSAITYASLIQTKSRYQFRELLTDEIRKNIEEIRINGNYEDYLKTLKTYPFFTIFLTVRKSINGFDTTKINEEYENYEYISEYFHKNRNIEFLHLYNQRIIFEILAKVIARNKSEI